MKIRNEERTFSNVKTITHQGYTFAFASTRSDDTSKAYDEVYWCVLDPAIGADVANDINSGDLTIDDGWTELVALDCATQLRVPGMNLITRDIPGVDADGNPNTSASLTQANPFVVLSDGDYIYLFRATSLNPDTPTSSGYNTADTPFPFGLLVDRFVFRQQNMDLAHATETRYVRSENADIPASDKDSLGSQSLDGQSFPEPAYLLPLNIELSYMACFDVVRVPVDKQFVWHIFAASGSLSTFSIPGSFQVPFDMSQLDGFGLNTTGTKYPLIEPSAIYQLAVNASNVSATVYYRQEPAHTKDGDSISMLTNAGILACFSLHNTPFGVLDFDLGLNGRIAGSPTEKWMENDLTPITLNPANAPFYGTALELNGRSDYISLPTQSSHQIAPDGGITIEAWIMPYKDPEHDQYVIELKTDNNKSFGVKIDKDFNLSLFAYLNGLTGIPAGSPPISPNSWTLLSMTIASNGCINLYVNGRTAFEGFYGQTLRYDNIHCSIGKSSKVSDSYFKGAISEIRVWNTNLSEEDLIGNQSIDVSNQNNIKLIYQLNEGQGNTLTNSADNTSDENAVIGGRWISAASPAQVSMPVLARDVGLLSIRGTLLPDIKNIGSVSLLPSADGLVRIAYRTDNDHWGSLHYDTRTQRVKTVLSWKNPEEAKDTARLLFTSLSAGTDFNKCQIEIIDDSDNEGRLSIIMAENQTADFGTNGSGVCETWTNLPAKLSDIVDIINGRMPDSTEEPDAPTKYDYANNVTRTNEGETISETELPDRLRPHASLLFAVNGIHQLDEDLDQSVPEDLTTIKYTYMAGADPRWVLDPVPAAVQNAMFELPESEKLKISGDVTIEAWAISQTHNNDNAILYQGYDTPYIFSLTGQNKLYAAKNEGDDTVIAISEKPIPDTSTWTHLAAAYHSSWGLHLHDEAYVKCGQLQRQPGKAITVEAWVCPDEQSIDNEKVQPIISQWADIENDRRFMLALDTDGKPVFTIHDSNGDEYIATGPHTLKAGEWTHLSGVYQAAGAQNMLYFSDSNNAYAQVLQNEGLSDAMTVEMWVRPESKTSSSDLSTLISCGRQDGQHSLFSLVLKSDRELEVRIYIPHVAHLNTYSTGIKIPFADNSEDASADTHIALVLDWLSASQLNYNVYINGVSQSEDTITVSNYQKPSALPASGWLLGAALDDSGTGIQKHYQGGMREVKLWSTARTQQQIIDHLNTPVSTAEAGLRGYWKLDSPPSDTDFGEDFSIQPRITNAVNSVSTEVQGDAYFYAAPVEASLAIFIDNNTPVYSQINQNKVPAKLDDSDATPFIGKTDEAGSGILSGIVDDIRIWTTVRLPEQLTYYQKRAIEKPSEHADLAAYWSFDAGKGQEVHDETGGNPGKIMGVRNIDNADDKDPFWVPTPITSYWTLFVDGQKVDTVNIGTVNMVDRAWLGSPDGSNFYNGYLAEVRLWNVERKQRDIRQTMQHPLRGDEEGLVAYWPCNDNQGAGIDNSVGLSDMTTDPCDAKFLSYSGTVYVAEQSWPDATSNLLYPPPVSDDVQYAINISNGITTQEAANMALSAPPAIAELDAGAGRVHIGIRSDGTSWLLDTDQEPDATELVYLGQIQTNAQIIGFIEGAPPLPSENLSIEQASNPDKYLGASSVSLEQGDEVIYSGISTLHGGGSLSGTITSGAEGEASIGISFPVKTNIFTGDFSGTAGFTLKLEAGAQLVASGRVSQNKQTSSDIVMDGAFEQNLYNLGNFPHNQLGVQPRRIYRPNNMGAAIVKSLVADYYAVRSKRTGATLGYLPVADSNIPPDTNVIMFKLNPNYVKNGSLDGCIGFDKDINYRDLGVSEKGSYYKVQEAYATKEKIRRQQAEYENYFSSLRAATPNALRSKEGWLKEVANRSIANTYVWTADGGLFSEEISEGASRREAVGLNFKGELSYNIKGEFEFLIGMGWNFGGEGDFKLGLSGNIEGLHTSASRDTASFNLQSKVDGEGFLGKQVIPIENVAVDGWGKRPATPGNFDYLNPANSLTAALIDAGVVTKIRVRYQPDEYTTNYTIAQVDNENYILEDTAGIFNVVVNDNLASFTPRVEAGQYPINYQAAPCPGKVLGYRFMSFYLDPDKENFNALAKTNNPDRQIIDKDWLDNPDDPNAIALKDALTRPNDVWRVFHRVTYVNRVPPEENAENTDDVKHVTIPNQTHRPDDISIARNSIVIKILLGYQEQVRDELPSIQHAGYPPSIRIIDENIAVLVESMNLPNLEAQKLANQLHNYMTAYIAPDQKGEHFRLKIQAEDCSESQGIIMHDDGSGVVHAGNISNGDWLQYDHINIPANGYYNFEFRIAGDDSSCSGKIKLQTDNGSTDLATIDIPYTGDWHNWTTVSQLAYLTKGICNIRLLAESSHGEFLNIDWWRISEAPLLIQAENYSDKSSQVTHGTCSDYGGGVDVESLYSDQWLKYNQINIPGTSVYKIEYRVASPNDGQKLSLAVNGTTQELDIPNTGGWQNWQTISHYVELEEGTEEFTITSTGNGESWNFNWWRIKERE
ncbi:carbohydrate-binding protein [Fulvivirga ulvae]|uniref:LamG-like jellyroll fold domain-containing protein n=1 Tax=Fulvivirga ulvae TaxID=2904245 RepID=UPI001F3DE582|nr:LamG-like jellyroll fold domain-containing protein [Fulvivirga ulvae]UII33170.1 carbohydrate-binding protein [Fulvivirga ulvae]